MRTKWTQGLGKWPGMVVFGIVWCVTHFMVTCPVAAQDGHATQNQQPTKEHVARLAAIHADRQNVIQTLAQTWATTTSETVEVLVEKLGSLRTDQLLAIQDASTLDQIKRIMLGHRPGDGDVVADLKSQAVEPLALGDDDEDLVFTPVTPCRIVDTRFAPGGAIPANSTRNFRVYGDASVMANQGGNIAGCPSPRGAFVDAGAVHINVTVVPVGGNGFVKVYPYLAPEPNASLVNFKLGANIANAATIKTCFSCGPDITVKVSQTAHVIVDVLGYYFGVEAFPPFRTSALVNPAMFGTATEQWSKLGNVVSFFKIESDTDVKIHLNTTAYSGTWSEHARFVTYQIRINDVPTSVAHDLSIYLGQTRDNLPLYAVSEGLPAGAHTVSVWIKATGIFATATNVSLGEAGGGAVTVEEGF